MRRRGLALILVVGVLGILAVLGFAFAVLSRLERRAASQRVSATQALLLARSGMDDAQARLDSGQDPAYGGEDWDRDGTLNGFEGAAEVTRPGILDTDICPVRQALRPSFFVKDSASLGADLKPAPKRIRIDGRERGYSGALSSGTWAIKAAPAGGFFVNGGLPSVQSNPASTSDLNTNLRRMFGILAEAIDREDGAADGSPVGRTDGENLIKLRPTTGWTSFNQVRDLAMGGSQAKLDALKDYLVLYAWTDRKVIAQTIHRRSGMVPEPPSSPRANVGFRSMSLLRMGNWASTANLNGNTRACPEPECIPHSNLQNEVPAGPLVGRAPVDLAWARTKRPALIALLGSLKGFYWRETGTDDDSNPWNTVGALKPAELALNWSAPSDDCRSVAGVLLGSTSDLRTWEAWNDFCDALPLTGTSGLAQGKKDLLKSNFNPNTDAVKFNPEDSMRRSMDKTDILVGSTEFHLGPPRAWKVSACGRTTGKVPAARVLSAETSPDRLFNLTTQAEFVAGNLGSLDLAGDESAFRVYGDPRYITASGGVQKTFGHTLPGCPASGLSLQTYPEVPQEWTSGIYPAPPVWDGQLKLATVETADGEYAGSGTMKFLARFDDSWDADYSGGGGNLAALPPLSFQGGPGDPIWPDNLWVLPSNRFPDGAFLEYGFLDGVLFDGSVPGYLSAGNVPPSQGTISYWIKPSYDTASHLSAYSNNAPVRCQFNNGRSKNVNVPRPGSGTCLSSACFSIAAGGKTGLSFYSGQTEKAFSFFWESCFWFTDLDDIRDEQARSTPVRDVRRRWYLVTCFWDMVTRRPAGATEKSMRILVDRGQASGDRNSVWTYADEPIHGMGGAGARISIHPDDLEGSPVDFTAPDADGSSAAFYLGNRGNYPQGTSPDATMDEFAIYDLGLGLGNGAANDGITQSERLAQQRYEAGRYYKESGYPSSRGLTKPPGASRNAGEWFSAPVDLGDARIRSLAWTQIVPRGLKGLASVPAGTPVEDFDNPPGSPPDGNDGRVLLELADPSVQVPYTVGPAYAQDMGGREIDALFRDPRGEGVARRVKSPFRLHAVFQPNVADPLHKAILDPLTLDDITVTYRPIDRSAMAAWREGE